MKLNTIKNKVNSVVVRMHKNPTLFILFLEIILGIGVSVVAFYAFWELTEEVLEQEKVLIDHAIMAGFYSIRTPWLTTFMQFVSFIGMDGILFLSVLIPIYFLSKHKVNRAIFFTVMIGMGAIVNLLLKFIILRPRPTLDPLAVEHTFSFPSGHSMNSFIFFVTLAYFYYYFTRKRKRSLFIFGIAVLIILCIGISRIYLGVHYPSDVIGGYLAGLLWFVSILVIDKTINFVKLFRLKP